MSQLIENIRALLFLFLGAICVVLSFRGFPFAMVSFLGSLIILTACTRGVQLLLYKDENPLMNEVSRLPGVLIAIALGALGFAVVKWGGLASISIGTITIGLDYMGIAVGVAGGLARLDNY